MGINIIDVAFAVALNFLRAVSSERILSCNGSLPEPCPGDNQICNLTSSECVCYEGFIFVGEECEVPDDHHSPGNGSTAAIITVFTLVLMICALVLVVRKYNLVQYIRQKIESRRNNDVMYEDVMIGNDDPPLSP